MKGILTAMKELITIALVGKTDASSAEEQLARDSQLKATNCRGDGSYTPAIDQRQLFLPSLRQLKVPDISRRQ